MRHISFNFVSILPILSPFGNTEISSLVMHLKMNTEKIYTSAAKQMEIRVARVRPRLSKESRYTKTAVAVQSVVANKGRMKVEAKFTFIPRFFITNIKLKGDTNEYKNCYCWLR